MLLDPSQGFNGFLCRGDLLVKINKDAKRRNNNIVDESGMRRERSQGYIDRAILDYTKAIHLQPSNYLVYLYRGRLFLNLNRRKEATYDFHAAFELNNSILQTFVQRALVLSFQRKYDQVIAEFEEKRKTQEIYDPTLWVLVAKAKIKNADYAGAVECFTKAVSLRSRDPQVYLQRGMCYERLGNWGDAANDYARCVQLQPNFARANFRKGLCKLKEGNERGVLDINRALKTDPTLFEAYLCRGSFYYSRACYAEAVQDCISALKLESLSIRAFLLRGACKYRMGQFGLAIGDFTKAGQLDGVRFFDYY